MDRPRILIAVSKNDVRTALKQLLARGGYQVAAEVTDGVQALRGARTSSPDLVLADADLPGINGFELGRALAEDRIAPVLIISQEIFYYAPRDLEQGKIKQQPVGYVVRPLSEANLFPAIESILSFQSYIRYLRAEIKSLQEKIESRKVIEQAKGILMQQLGIPEAEAYRKIQKQSMDKCLPMRKVAEALILAADLKS